MSLGVTGDLRGGVESEIFRQVTASSSYLSSDIWSCYLYSSLAQHQAALGSASWNVALSVSGTFLAVTQRCDWSIISLWLLVSHWDQPPHWMLSTPASRAAHHPTRSMDPFSPDEHEHLGSADPRLLRRARSSVPFRRRACHIPRWSAQRGSSPACTTVRDEVTEGGLVRAPENHALLRAEASGLLALTFRCPSPHLLTDAAPSISVHSSTSGEVTDPWASHRRCWD